jgi:hypothetical protein
MRPAAFPGRVEDHTSDGEPGVTNRLWEIDDLLALLD